MKYYRTVTFSILGRRFGNLCPLGHIPWRLRVVFDTNIYVSAFVLSGSRADAALKRVIDSIEQLVVSKAIIDELLTVLARKFARDADELARVAVFLSDLARDQPAL